MDLEAGFEATARDALLDDIVQSFTDEDGPIWAAVEKSHDILEAYGREHDYNVGPIIEALSDPAITRTDDAVEAYWGWHHPGAPHFEFGTSDHVVNGAPLSFVWEDPPQWVREEFDAEGDGYRVFFSSVDVAGLPESRFVREGLHHARRLIQS